MLPNDLFPNAQAEEVTQTSPAAKDYNCIAWAAGSHQEWWWPDPAWVSYWPEHVPRVETVDAFYAAFSMLGYQRCLDGNFDAGFEKIALYARNGKPTHAARQLADGYWTSKLGEYIDITHTLRSLEGPVYGQVAGFMRRPS